MSTTTGRGSPAPAGDRPALDRPALDEVSIGQARAFAAVLWRDLYVTTRQLPAFLAQVILQPLFLLFVFGKVLGSLGYTRGHYADLLFPGLIALTAVITGMQSLSFPLAAEFGWTMEIEDRLLAPMVTALVALEKIVFAMLRAVVASTIMVPVGILVLGSVPWRWDGFGLFVGGVLLGSLLGAAMGLVLGTAVLPTNINLVFSLVFTPLLFTGCSQYPWPSLSRLPWFQAVTAMNPMTYVSEMLRAALVPQVPHIRPWICFVVLLGALSVLLALGARGFYRRALG
jgi:ABC-2 type transport system permease protein